MKPSFIHYLNLTFVRPLLLTLSLFGVLLLSNPTHENAASSEPKEQGSPYKVSNPLTPADLGPSLVSVSGRQLIVQKRNPNGTLAPAAPYTIRGVNWSPASRNTNTSTSDQNNANVRRPEFGIWASVDIPLMKQMNVNTVRIPIDPGIDANGTAVLDQLFNNGIMVVMTVDDGVNNTTRVQQAVNHYKNHPALLMFTLGNEWNINFYYGVASSASDAAIRTQNAATLIRSLDPNHPVSTSYGETAINGLQVTEAFVNTTCPSVDVWSLNIYRGNTFGHLFEEWSSITTKPMFIGEFGTDAFRSLNQNHPPAGAIDEVMQAQWDLSEWNDLFRNLSAVNPSKAALGGFAFEWNDEWWKVQPSGSQQVDGCDAQYCAGHPDQFGNEEYFGIVDIDRHPRLLYQTLTTVFSPNYRKSLADFDGDGKSDIAVWRPSDGNWYWINSSNSTFSAFQFGSSGDRIVPGDYDGDGKTDFAVYRSGTWYIWGSAAGFSGMQFGLASDLPAQGDFDGDGKTDIAVFRSSTGTWYIQASTAGFSGTQFGTLGDKPVVGDYDGDGKADIAVYRPSEGVWYQLRSTAGFTAAQFGISTDKVVPGDYDGDGKTDLAVYRDSSQGVWYMMESTAGFAAMSFGTTNDVPVPGDFDGDGKTDVSVFRASSGTWYLQRSTSGFAGSQFGATTDKPAEASYVPTQ